jgi:hypothetical protein
LPVLKKLKIGKFLHKIFSFDTPLITEKDPRPLCMDWEGSIGDLCLNSRPLHWSILSFLCFSTKGIEKGHTELEFLNNLWGLGTE